DLATNGVDKPVLNVFRMYGMMKGSRLKVQNAAEIPLDSLLKKSVRGDDQDIHALACADPGKSSAAVMVWNYYDGDMTAPSRDLTVRIKNIPAKKVLLQHYRIDDEHSNSYEAWKKMGSPQSVSGEQFSVLEKAGQLQQLEEDKKLVVTDKGEVSISLTLPGHGISLLRLRW
ncbi:MAG TPA: beta-xylosidase, partial [Puia sp.]|nr:beta-xylosidase [Puia sp.]